MPHQPAAGRRTAQSSPATACSSINDITTVSLLFRLLLPGSGAREGNHPDYQIYAGKYFLVYGQNDKFEQFVAAFFGRSINGGKIAPESSLA